MGGLSEDEPLKSRDELRRQIERLQDRISKLTEASVRISESLDVDTVLREIVEGARALTEADYGIITTINDSGQVEDFVTSGSTPEEHRQMEAWPDGPRLFEHFRDLPGTLRLRDAPAYVRSLGFSSHLIWPETFLGTPMRHRGLHMGNFYLGRKEGRREFTKDDEEILTLFASQAAVAIANARTHRDEQRARADLEALVDTSPVGVAVFEAMTGKPVLLNREAKRIVKFLRTPGDVAEQLLEILICRRADGQEIAFKEFPLSQILNNATTVRDEEIVLQVPDGRSVTTLVNATPICAEDGNVESVVVTLQDLAKLEDLERMRAEFLGMVSHELRAPLISIKGSTTTMLSALPTPNVPEILQIIRIIDEQADHMRNLISDLLDAGHIETGTLSVSPEPVNVTSLVDQARNTFLSGGGRHTIHIDLPLDLPRVMADRQRIVQVVNNLLSNAARHSPESSPIRIAAAHEEVHVAISISDEGRGVPPDLLPILFRKHARLDGDRGIRGSGLGLAICKGLVEAHGGRIRAESDGPGLGARFTFTIPVAEDAASDTASGLDRNSFHTSRSGRARNRILVVDDDPQTLRYVRETLTAAGYSPFVTGEPREVSRLIKRKNPRLVLLDLVLPGTDGIELMKCVPELTDLPVIFISAYGRDETIARALELGAIDYIVKPFSPTELVARVQAALRRYDATPAPFQSGNLTIDYEERRVTLADCPVQLTATEYELLRLLSVNAGRIVTYGSLLAPIVGPSDNRRPSTAPRRRQAAPTQARRRCCPAHLHLQRAPSWLPYGPKKRAVTCAEEETSDNGERNISKDRKDGSTNTKYPSKGAHRIRSGHGG